jgi:hypothetical protein
MGSSHVPRWRPYTTGPSDGAGTSSDGSSADPSHGSDTGYPGPDEVAGERIARGGTKAGRYGEDRRGAGLQGREADELDNREHTDSQPT